MAAVMCPSAYALLGHIVESIEGKLWENLVAEEVF